MFGRKNKSFLTHLNRHNVIRLDIQRFLFDESHLDIFIDKIQEAVIRELEEEYGKKQAELEEHKLSLQADYNREMKELEPMLLNTIITVVEKVFHIQFSDKKDILLYLVENAVMNIEGCKSFRIRVGEEQRVFLERRKEEILEQVGHDITLEFLSDSSFQEDQCVIETDTGIFDCGTGVQLENLVRDIKALIS